MNKPGSPYLAAYIGLVTVFLLSPIVIAIILAFSNVSQLVFPPPGLSIEWYVVVWENRKFVDGFVVSTIIATISSIMAGVAGTLAGIAINNYRFFGRSAIQSLVIMPLIIPAVVIGLGLLQTLVPVGIRPGILAASLGHSIIGIPYVVFLVLAALSGYDIRLEHAAQSLGATRLRTFLDITFPAVRPGMIAGVAFAFLMSFDNVAMSIFLARGDPLPLRLMQHIQYYADPSVAAVSTVLVVISLVGLILIGRLLRKRDVGNLV
ncbi:MAG: ABC transporter permease [Alphaproteobacteria bacterium]|nr:ABC transporter permease [Alphaproteobacteria bacterium]